MKITERKTGYIKALKNGAAWLGIVLTSAMLTGYLAGEVFPVPLIILILLLGSISLLLNLYEQVHERLIFNANQFMFVSLLFVGIYYPPLWGALPLIVCNFGSIRAFYITGLLLFLPLLRPDALLQILALYMALTLTALITVLINKYQHLQKLYFQTLDNLTSERINLEASRQRMLSENKIARENDILSERNRIAREIHDHVGHRLTAAILQISALKLTAPDELKPVLLQLQLNLDKALEEVRTSVHALHAESLDLVHALQKMEQTYSFCPVFLAINLTTQPPAAIHHALLAICEEALINTAKHSNADRIDISLNQSIAAYQLLIVDNGNSKKTQTDFTASPGIGLYNMEEQVKKLGGQITFSRERGFRIFVRIPVKDSASNPVTPA